jgi:hypothetical protein
MNEMPTFRPTFRIVSAADLDHLPQPTFLVESVLLQDSLAALIGRYGSYKSFIALDLALSVATGLPWLGHHVSQGPVFYVTAEGHHGVRQRTKAWVKARGYQVTSNFWCVLDPVQFLDDNGVTAFVETIQELAPQPALIVVDTVAKCMVGGDENSARDMGHFLHSVDRVRRATGATMLVVHHTNAGGASRGSTALPAGIDTEVVAEVSNMRVRLRCTKQKDASPFPEIHLATREVHLEGTGAGATSLVLERIPPPPSASASGTRRSPGNSSPATPSFARRSAAERILELLPASGIACTNTEWLDACSKAGISPRTFARHKKTLVDTGQVHVDAAGRPIRYWRVGTVPVAP